MMLVCTLCGRLFVGTAEQSASWVRRCKCHADVTKFYGFRPEPAEPAPRLCCCGHPFAGAHRTPGTECAVFDCDCESFRPAEHG